jgi:hypothetical protein
MGRSIALRKNQAALPHKPPAAVPEHLLPHETASAIENHSRFQ